VHLPFDSDRHNVIWVDVDDFSESEAHLFLDNLGAFPLNVRIDANGTDLNASLRRRVFEFVGVGTRAAAATLVDLVHLLGNVQLEAIDCRVDAWIDEQIDDAQITLGRLTFVALADHRGDFDLHAMAGRGAPPVQRFDADCAPLATSLVVEPWSEIERTFGIWIEKCAVACALH
jgi:hypothetical protein